MNNARFPQWCARLIPLAFILVIAGLVGFGGRLLLAGPAIPAKMAVTSQAGAPGQAEINALKSRIEDLNNQADALKEKENDLKWILGFILGAAGLFAIVQAATTWFSAASFTKQAEDGLSHIEKIEHDLTERYPLFSEAEARRKQALENLTGILKANSPVNNPDEGFNWQRHFYERLPLIQRQELLAVERFLAYEIPGQNADNEEYARTLRRLAQFYFSKFIYEKGRGFGYFDDLERAEYFLELARRRIGSAFYLSNDLGNVHLESFKARMEYLAKRLPPGQVKSEAIINFQQAIRDFTDSIGSQPRQLRAYYNLAVIEADHRHNEQEAVKWLEKGLQYPNWEHEPVPELTCAALFNLACYHARLSSDRSVDAEQAQVQVQKCMESLGKAAEIGQVSPGDVEREYFFSAFSVPLDAENPSDRSILSLREGDLYALAHSRDEHTKARLEELRPKLSVNFRGGSSDPGGYY
jgi:hypothetical protein